MANPIEVKVRRMRRFRKSMNQMQITLQVYKDGSCKVKFGRYILFDNIPDEVMGEDILLSMQNLIARCDHKVDQIVTHLEGRVEQLTLHLFSQSQEEVAGENHNDQAG